MSTLSTNQIVVEYIIKEGDIQKAQQNFDKLTLAEKQAIVNTQKLNQTLKETGTEGKKATDQVASGLNNVGGTASKIGPLLAAAFSVAAVSAFLKEVTNTTAQIQQYQKAINFATGSNAEGAKSFQLLKDTAQKYGLDLKSLIEGYKGFSASNTLAGTSIAETNRQFVAVSKAASVLSLSAEKTGLVLKGLEQIAGKGTVSMEELRGQIGDSLPGALGIAARAMNMTTQDFIKFTSAGKLASEEFLPRFADELEKTFGPQAEKNLNSLTQSQNRFNSSIDNLVLAVGTKLEPFLKGAYDLASGIATQLASIGTKEKAQTAENLGLKRAEADLVKQLIKYGGDLTVQNREFIRQQEAVLLLLGMEEKIDKQLAIVAESRIKAAGDFGGIATQNLIKQQKELDILIAEEKELSKIAGIEFKRGQEKKALSEADIKALKQQYQLEEKRLEILAQIRKIELDSAAGNLGADKALYDAKLNLRKQYTAKGLTFSKEETDLLKAQSKKASEDLIQQDKMDWMESKNSLDDYLKNSGKAYDDYLKEVGDKKLKQVEVDKSANKQMVKNEEEKNRKIIEITSSAAQIGSSILDQFTNFQQQRTQNEISALNAKYDAEIRLAGDNQQKIMELNEKRRQEEKALRTKEFEAQRAAAIAQVVFKTAPIIAEYLVSGVLAPLAIAGLATAAAQIAFIAAQPVPEFKEGTKGKPFKGGKAIVGEIGKEWVVTTSGTVYETPGTATLVDLPKGSQVIPHHEVVKSERFMGSKLFGQSKSDSATGQIVERLISLENTMSKLPITSLTMDEKGFTKKIQTKSRETKILNNRFGN